MDLLDKMATYVRVVEAGSFSAAGKQLRISSGAVSRQIATLEEDLRRALLRRSTRRMEITPAGREHFRGKLDATHEAFKAHVHECRPNVDMAKVANGDYWLAREGLALGLVDEIMTGDDLLFRARDAARLYEVSTEARKTLLQQLLSGLGGAAQSAADVVIARLAAR